MFIRESPYDPHTQEVLNDLQTRAGGSTSDTILVDADHWEWVTDPLLHEARQPGNHTSAEFYVMQHEVAKDLIREYSALGRLLGVTAYVVNAAVESDETGLDMTELGPLAEFLAQHVGDGTFADLHTLRVDDQGRLDPTDFTYICEHDLFVEHPTQEDLELAAELRQAATALPQDASHYDIPVALVTDVIAPLVEIAVNEPLGYEAAGDAELMETAYLMEAGIEDWLALMRQAAALLGPLASDDAKARARGLDPMALATWQAFVTQARTPKERYLAEHNTEDPEFEDASL